MLAIDWKIMGHGFHKRQILEKEDLMKLLKNHDLEPLSKLTLCKIKPEAGATASKCSSKFLCRLL